jgi:hypothetical protein
MIFAEEVFPNPSGGKRSVENSNVGIIHHLPLAED